MRKSSIEKEVLRSDPTATAPPSQNTCGRGKTIAISLIDMGLGDRIIMEAPLRLHKRNNPNDYLIAISDKRAGVDFPLSLRDHFDEIWWIANGNGSSWDAKPRSTLARCVRDEFIDNAVEKVYTASWRAKQFPRNPDYTIQTYHCFNECNLLREHRFWPKVVVPPADRRWAKQMLRRVIPDEYKAFVSVHVRRYPRLAEKNLAPSLIGQIMDLVRTRGRVAFLLIGRDDEPPGISGCDVFSFVGERWTFEQTAAVLAQTRLFIGADSAPTHAAAAMGVPAVVLGCYGNSVRPFTDPERYVYLSMRNSPRIILNRIERFMERLNQFFNQEEER